MRKLTLMLLVCLFTLGQAWAQSRTVTGTVKNEKGEPTVGASVIIKGTNNGTVTDDQGNFSIGVNPADKTLLITALNMESTEVKIGNQPSLSIVLKSTENALQEVVVVGYGKTTKEAFTGTAKVVDGQQLLNKNVTNVSQALAGEVAGVRVINSSGQPGTNAIVRIRGIGSVNGNRGPLYVVDGVPFSGGINSLNPNDLENVTVLKDAAATSIYGSRGANGVIVVTTKNGRGRKSYVEVDGRYGTNRATLPRYSTIKSPEEFIELSWEAMYNNGVAIGNAAPGAYANSSLFSANGISPNNNIWKTAGADLIDSTSGKIRPGVQRLYDPENWEDYAFQNSNRSEVNLRMGGGDAKTNYFTSFGYLEDIGYSVNSNFKRLTGRVNLNHEVKPWLVTNVNVSYANAQTNNNGQGSSSNSVFWFADNIPSLYPLFMRDASGNKIPDPKFGGDRYDYGETGRKFGSLTNAIADANFNTSTATRHELNGNAGITIKFTKDLAFENTLGVQYYNNTAWNLNNKFYGSAASQNGSISQTRTELLNLNFLNLLRYRKRFGDHNIEALVAHEATDYSITSASASGYNLVSNYSLELANAIVKNPTANSFTNENKLESYFGQVNYDYAGTYFLSGTIRRDGSSKFIKGNTWGTFGSVGAGWVISKTNLLNKVDIIRNLKLKASYGILGDQTGLGFYPGYDAIAINNLDNQPSFGVPTPGNPDITWEQSSMFQTGIEFSLGDFLDGTIDYYIKNTNNLIFDRRVGISNGYALITVNDGQLRNNGLEFDLVGHIVKNKDFFIDLGVNGEVFNNKITRMPIDPSTGNPKVIDVQGAYGWATGRSVYDFYIREFNGVDPADGRSTWKVYYDDLNGDGAFNTGEQIANLEQWKSENPAKAGNIKEGLTKTYSQATLFYSGKSAIPKIRGGINLSAGYKGLTLAVQMLYNIGGYSYDGAYANLMGNGLIGGNNWHTDINNRWQAPGDVTNVPRISNNYDPNVNSQSTRFITKADYFSLNNIRLGYNFPSTMLSKTKLVESLSIFLSADNIWLLTERDGFNPTTAESGNSDIYNYAPMSTYTLGMKVRF